MTLPLRRTKDWIGSLVQAVRTGNKYRSLGNSGCSVLENDLPEPRRYHHCSRSRSLNINALQKFCRCIFISPTTLWTPLAASTICELRHTLAVIAERMTKSLDAIRIPVGTRASRIVHQ